MDIEVVRKFFLGHGVQLVPVRSLDEIVNAERLIMLSVDPQYLFDFRIRRSVVTAGSLFIQDGDCAAAKFSNGTLGYFCLGAPEPLFQNDEYLIIPDNISKVFIDQGFVFIARSLPVPYSPSTYAGHSPSVQ